MMTSATPSRAGIFLIMLVSACCSILIMSKWWWLDDAFISFRYARNLYEGLGLVYNAGERVEGYTNFLWTLFAAGGLWLRLEPIVVARTLSVIAQVLALWLLFMLGQRDGRHRYLALIAPLFLAFHVSSITYPSMGMETTFFAMLTLLAFFMLSRGYYSGTGQNVVLGFVFLGMALTRFDGFVLVLILAGYKVLVEREAKPLLPAAVVFILGMVIYNSWRLSYYPTPLPNTFYAKVGFSFDQALMGLRYLRNFVVRQGHYILGLAVVPFLFGRTSGTSRFAAWVIFWQAVYVMLVGGDWMPHFRFLIPVLPLMFLLMQDGLLLLHERLVRLMSRRTAWVTAGAAAFFFLGFILWPTYRAVDPANRPEGAFFRTGDAQIIGEALGEKLPGDFIVGIEWAGILPYFMANNVLDIAGLTDADIVQQDFPAFPMGKAVTVDYIVGRKPHIIVICARIFESPEQAMTGSTLRIKWVRKGDWTYDFYASLLSPESPYEIRIAKLGENQFLPLLVRKDIAANGQIFVGSSTVLEDSQKANREGAKSEG